MSGLSNAREFTFRLRSWQRGPHLQDHQLLRFGQSAFGMRLS